jgi:hypothetical protein
MRATLVRYEKFIVKRRYIVEITVYEVPRSSKYPDRLKWVLICFDRVTKTKVLLDNHHPKGPHVHIDDQKLPYIFKGLDQLVRDFRQMVTEHMGVQI